MTTAAGWANDAHVQQMDGANRQCTNDIAGAKATHVSHIAGANRNYSSDINPHPLAFVIVPTSAQFSRRREMSRRHDKCQSSRRRDISLRKENQPTSDKLSRRQDKCSPPPLAWTSSKIEEVAQAANPSINEEFPHPPAWVGKGTKCVPFRTHGREAVSIRNPNNPRLTSIASNPHPQAAHAADPLSPCQCAGDRALDRVSGAFKAHPWHVLGSSGGGRHAGSEERVYSRFTTRPPWGAVHQFYLCHDESQRMRGIRNGRRVCGYYSLSVCFHGSFLGWSRRVSMRGTLFDSFRESFANYYRLRL